MRLTEFHERVRGEFGRLGGDTTLRDHVLTQVGGRTAREALEVGVAPRAVWRALCEDFDVPRERW